MNTLQTFFTRTRQNKTHCNMLLLGVLTLCSMLLALCFGSTGAGSLGALQEILQGQLTSAGAKILLYVRLPRVLAAALAGASLAVSGVLLQAVLSNPLASPNVIGVNAGAGFFTFLCLSIAPSAIQLRSTSAFAGALAATLLVYGIAAVAGTGKLTILLSGMAISTIFTAGMNALKTFFPNTLYQGSSFLIGGFSGISLADLSPVWAFLLLALLAAMLTSRQIDVLCLGEETAKSLGLAVGAVRFWLILLASVLAGGAVSFSGLLSFVGLLVPHIARRLFGQAHRVLLPASAMLGASFVLLCDLLSRTLFAPYEIPVGILLSLLGGPFFLCLLLRRRKEHAK